MGPRYLEERARMIWNQWYAIRSHVRSSLWAVPLLALLLEQATIHLVMALEHQIDWMVPAWPWAAVGTQIALQTIITLVLSFLVFTFGSMLVAIQVASGQLTPRIIATTLLRDNVIRFSVGQFVFTLLFAIGAVARIDQKIPHALAWVSAILGLASIVTFLFLIDYAARLLRPVSIVWRVGELGIEVIDSVYPKQISETETASAPCPRLGVPDLIVAHQGKSAVILAVNLDGLVAEAKRINCVVEFVPSIGDFVAVGEPLFMVRGNSGSIDERGLCKAVAFGPERTIEQDSTFAFRVIVDIAIKALSKAINDPTTAVLAIDQLHRLLRVVGQRHLHDQKIADDTGQLRVIFRTPNWDDFVQLSFREIRLYGAENFQIARRLRAMIDNLMQVLPERRRPALAQELMLLDRAIDVCYPFPEDRVVARIPDLQGLGGSSAS